MGVFFENLPKKTLCNLRLKFLKMTPNKNQKRHDNYAKLTICRHNSLIIKHLQTYNLSSQKK